MRRLLQANGCFIGERPILCSRRISPNNHRAAGTLTLSGPLTKHLKNPRNPPKPFVKISTHCIAVKMRNKMRNKKRKNRPVFTTNFGVGRETGKNRSKPSVVIPQLILSRYTNRYRPNLRSPDLWTELDTYNAIYTRYFLKSDNDW